MTSVTFQYDENGTPGITLHIYGDHTGASLIHSFTNVQPGDFITVEASMAGLDRFGPKIYFDVGQNVCLTQVHTSCYINIMGNTYLGFTVVAYTDYRGNHCYQPASLGNRVFEDLNGNGLQDIGENGVDGITVILCDENGVPEDTEVTAGGGLYQFDNLEPGDYLLSFPNLPQGYIKTIANAGADDEMDSDVDKASPTTPLIHLEPSQVDDSWDLGILAETNFPVEFLGFEGEIEGNQAVLRWTTGSELNNDRFEIERATTVGEFEWIGTIGGAGTTQQVQEYSFTDMDVRFAGSSVVYYRIRQVDFDGRFDFSTVIELDLSEMETSSFSLYPNPATDRVYIESDAAGAELLLVDASGRTLFRNQLSQQEGLQQHQLDLSSLPRGIYWVQLNHGLQVQSQKVVKR